ncbi:MAG: HAMP domain-containing protein [Burkholderiales bacterium]|nr:HAMP domain-containing protein [Burkholderiales bacterium]
MEILDPTNLRPAAGREADATRPGDPERTRARVDPERTVVRVDPERTVVRADPEHTVVRPVHRRTVVRCAMGADAAVSTTTPLRTQPTGPPLPPLPPPRALALPAGTRLHEYGIESVLGQGGFGITYLATDVHLHAKVAIKEFLPEGIVFRTAEGEVRPNASGHVQRYEAGLRSFLAEARTLASFRHPAIVRVARFFEARGTAYMVLEYEEGEPLRSWWPQHRGIGEARLVELLLPLLEGLAAVHEAGFLHRDIKPDNIQVRAGDGSLVLLDFGSAGQVAALAGSDTVIVTPGYAPIEQYGFGGPGAQGPWTDLYALAATLYWAATARRVPDAEARALKPDLYMKAAGAEAAACIAATGQRYGRAYLTALDAALQTDARRRPRDVARFRHALCADHVASLDLQAALQHDAAAGVDEAERDRAGDAAAPADEAAADASPAAARGSGPMWGRLWRPLHARCRRTGQRLRPPRDWPLAFKLAALLVATALLPMWLAGAWNVRGGSEALARSELANVERIARSGAGRIGQFIADARHVARGLAGDADFAAFLQRPEVGEMPALQRRLQGLVRADPDLQLIILMDLQGRALISSDSEVMGRSFAFRRYFREASAGRAYTSGIVVGAVAGASGFFIAEPVSGPDGAPVGVLVLRLLAASVASIMDELGEDGVLTPMLVDGDGVVLHHPRRDRIFASLVPLTPVQQAEVRADQRFRRDQVASLDEPELARLMMTGAAAGHGSYRSRRDGREEIAGFAAVPGHDWRVAVSASRHAFEAPMRELFHQLLWSLLLVGALFTGLALRFARGIVRPIRDLTAAADALKAGDYEAARVPVRARDEVGQLGRTFNVMLEVLRQRDVQRRVDRG